MTQSAKVFLASLSTGASHFIW